MRKILFAGRAFQPIEFLLRGRKLREVRRFCADRGGGTPYHRALRVSDDSVETGARQAETRFGERVGHHEPALGIHFGRGNQQIYLAQEPLASRFPAAVVERAIERVAGERNENRQHHARRERDAGVQGKHRVGWVAT
jgi:hypothetical protein